MVEWARVAGFLALTVCEVALVGCGGPGPKVAASGNGAAGAGGTHGVADGAAGAGGAHGGADGAAGAGEVPAAPVDAAAMPSDGASPPVDAPQSLPDAAATDVISSNDGGVADGPPAPWPAVADYGAKGPFPITRDVNTGPGGAYDVFRPATLGAGGRRHPIISWANGTLFGIADYQKLLEHWASHGFVVIAGHTNTTAGGGTHKAGIDWLIAEAARAGSLTFGSLDTNKIGAAGHSQGGGATIAAGAQKAGPTKLVTTLPLMPILSFESDKTILGKQTVPMLNINATMDDRDPQGAIPNQIFDAANAELVQAAFIGIHEDAMTPAMFAPTLGWFRLRLMDDTAARAMFYPVPTCGLCTNAAWKQVRAKNVP
jgi:Chlorophyllase enzyme